jgi:hypothetical protein
MNSQEGEIFVPSSVDWRSPLSDDQASLGRPEYAAEFLRRDPRFQKEYARMSRMIRKGAVDAANASAAFARRWGLSFRLCPRRSYRDRPVAARARSNIDHPRAGTGRLC